MRVRNEEMKISVLSLAVQSALAVMFALPISAYAADAAETDATALRHPSNFVEIGIENVSDKSAKFGEYNGLNDSGGEVIGNFSVSGGDAYGGGDGTLRWGITGNDLGTTSRELGATVGNQGRWNLSIGYDELRHNITDTYQTPQQGSMGGNTFTLPATFQVFNASATPSARDIFTNPAKAASAAAFHTEEVGTTRKNSSFGVGINLSPQLSLKFDYNHLAQSGAKLIAAAALGGITVPGTATTWRGEAVAILMNPTNYKTDTFNLALDWVGEKGHITGSYFGSIFRDGYDSLSYQNPMMTAAAAPAAGVFQTTTLSTAPDNQLHQLNLSGGFVFSPTTKLTGGLSYGRNTQNDNFLSGMPEIVLAPQASLNGRVITKHADLKLTNRTTKDLSLSATFKYNERDNKTPSNLYQYYQINNITPPADAAANAPYSNKKTNFELAGDYRLDKRQSIRLAYDYEKINRWCDNYALAANCLISPSSTEDKLGIKYKLKANDEMSLSAGYTHANRDSTFDHNAITPITSRNLLIPTDVNARDFPGFEAFTYSSRKQDMLKAGVNWQVSEKLDLGMEGRYANDNYGSTLGVQGSRTTGINLDATYSYSENASISAYASWQNSKKDLRVGTTGGVPAGVNVGANYALLVAPTNVWSNILDEDSNAIGINTKHKLMGGKLELTGDLSYSLDKSRYSTQVPYLLTCSAVTTLTCGDLPDIKSQVTSLKITGLYSLDKSSKVSIGYMYQQLKSDDYFYNTYQGGYTPLRVMPTNQQSGSYTVNVVAVSYIHNFK